jgi:orotidine-5'-phosphate decarboxylase
MRPPLAPKDRLVFGLDVSTSDEAERLTVALEDSVGVFKVGLELFSAVGPNAVTRLVTRGKRVFVDLKLHDIPATIGRATAAVRDLGAQYLTVHTTSGREGMRAAAAAVRGSSLELLGVTVLTSANDAMLAEIGMRGAVAESVVQLAKLAMDSGLRGLVCSPMECELLRAELGKDVLLVTPGVRSASDAAGDQQRFATPAQAIANGADMLVVGRPIRDAADPSAMAARFLTEIEQALR